MDKIQLQTSKSSRLPLFSMDVNAIRGGWGGIQFTLMQAPRGSLNTSFFRHY